MHHRNLKPKLQPPLYHVDIVQLPKQKQNITQKQPHVVASNINRQAQSKIFSKTEKIPLSSKPQNSAKNVKISNTSQTNNQQKTVSKNQIQIKHQTKQTPAPVYNKIKPPKPSYKISGNLFQTGNKNIPNINSSQQYQGNSNVKAYESSNPKKQATIEIGTESIKYVSYMKLLKDKIQNVWVYPEQARLKNEQGTLLVRFGINKNGSLAYAQVVHSSGYPILDEAAIKAIKEASPFNPLPDRFGVDRLNIYASFSYELLYHYVQ